MRQTRILVMVGAGAKRNIVAKMASNSKPNPQTTCSRMAGILEKIPETRLEKIKYKEADTYRRIPRRTW